MNIAEGLDLTLLSKQRVGIGPKEGLYESAYCVTHQG